MQLAAECGESRLSAFAAEAASRALAEDKATIWIGEMAALFLRLTVQDDDPVR